MESMANYNQLLSMAKKLRSEKEKWLQLQTQKEEHKIQLGQCESRRNRLQQQLQENRQVNASATFHSVIQRAEDAIRFHQYMLNEKLPREVEQRVHRNALLEQAIQAPNPSPADLEQINEKVSRFVYQLATRYTAPNFILTRL